MRIYDQKTQPLPTILAILYANETFEQRCRRVYAFARRTGERYLFVFNKEDKRRRQVLGLPLRPSAHSYPAHTGEEKVAVAKDVTL